MRNHHLSNCYFIYDLIKQNQLEVRNVDFRIKPNNESNILYFFNSLCLATKTCMVFVCVFVLFCFCLFVNDVYNQTEILKLNLTKSRLILLDHTTYNHIFKMLRSS